MTDLQIMIKLMEAGGEELMEKEGEYLVIENYVENALGNDEFVWGKDGIVWIKKEPTAQRRTLQTNIIRISKLTNIKTN